MDLAEPEGNEGVLARKQLLALGRAAVPMLEKLCDTSREPLHRQMLALILAHAGRYERLGVLFGQGEAPYDQELDEHLKEFALRAEAYPPGERVRLLVAIAAIRPQPRFAGYRAMLQLMVGDHSDLGAKLTAMEALEVELPLYWQEEPIRLYERLPKLLAKDASLAGVFARRLRDPKCPDAAADLYLETLQETVLQHLDVPAIAKWMRRLQKNFNTRTYAGSIVRKLEARGRFDAITELVSIKQVGEAARDYLAERYPLPGGASAMPGGWGKALLTSGSYSQLHQVAERNDALIAPFVEFLGQRKELAPNYAGYGERKGVWRPSAKYAAAMRKVLARDDPVVQAIALEALALEAPGKESDLVSTLGGLILKAPDYTVQEFALYALLLRFKARPETGRAVARVVVEDFAHRGRRMGSNDGYLHSPLHDLKAFGSVFVGRQYRTSATAWYNRPDGTVGMPYRGYGGWVILELGNDVLASLLPHVWRLGNTEVLAWIRERLGPERFERRIVAALPGISDLEAASAVLALWGVDLSFLVRSPEGRDFLKSVATARDLDVWRRFRAVDLAWPASVTWFDWPPFLASDDPLVRSLLCTPSSHPSDFDSVRLRTRIHKWLSSRPAEETSRLFAALARNRDSQLRMHAMNESELSHEKRKAFLERALEDPDGWVRGRALQLLVMEQTVSLEPLLIRLLSEPRYEALRRSSMGQIVPLLIKAGSAKAMVPLVTLLDHPDLEVRAQARQGLREIKRALEEKAEWKRIVKELQKQTDPGKKKE